MNSYPNFGEDEKLRDTTRGKDDGWSLEAAKRTVLRLCILYIVTYEAMKADTRYRRKI